MSSHISSQWYHGILYAVHDFGHRERGRRLQIASHSDSDNLHRFGSSYMFSWVYADTASLASPAHPASLKMTSSTLAASICDAEDPCCPILNAWGDTSLKEQQSGLVYPLFVLLQKLCGLLFTFFTCHTGKFILHPEFSFPSVLVWAYVPKCNDSLSCIRGRQSVLHVPVFRFLECGPVEAPVLLFYEL